MNEYIIAVIIGIVEGITEYLPISSTGHMILVGNMIGFTGEKASVFEVFIQLGAILAVLILYRNKFIEMLKPDRIIHQLKPSSVRALYAGEGYSNTGIASDNSNNGLTVIHILAGIVPVMGVGYILHKPIKNYLFSPLTVIIGLVAGAVLMLAAEKFARKQTVDDIDSITLSQAFWVGLFQILSLWPGFSRSGSTISGGLFLGMSRKTAAEFSFIIAVPLMSVACLYDFLKIWQQLDISDIKFFAIGFAVAFAVAYLSIVWFISFLNRSSLASFAIYRFIVAGFSVWYFFLR
jgi:undecaprenyl-diphosphatase